MYHFAGIPLSVSIDRGTEITIVDLREWYFYSFGTA